MSVRDELLAIPDEKLRQGHIASAALVFMDFRDSPKRWWAGFGPLIHAGHEWLGVGDLISVSEIPAPFDMSAEPVTFEFAPTPEMVSKVKDQKHQVSGRRVIVYDQMFAVADQGAGPWQPLTSQPWVAFTGTMEKLAFTATGATERRLTLTCEGQFVRRNAPPRGLLTDLDQRARHPGDRGLERVALHKDHEVRWS